MTEQIDIYYDNRETRSEVVNNLAEMDCNIVEKTLDIGDFIISDRIGIERKTVDDFLSSMFDGRLFEQLEEMSKCYEKPVLIIEGGESLYSKRDVHPNAIRGALSSIAIDLSVPILWSCSEKDTAFIILRMAKREQDDNDRSVSIRNGKTPSSLKEKQLYLVSGLPGVDKVLGERLLDHFKSPERVFSASKEELMEVDGIGSKIAASLRDVLTDELKCRCD